MFGSSNNNNSNNNTSAFGAGATSNGNGLFGNTHNRSSSFSFGSSTPVANSQPNSGGLFNNSSNKNTPTGSLFGNPPAKLSTNSSLGNFTNTNGNTNGSPGGLFGNSVNSGATGGLFGNKSNASIGAPSSGLFGNSNAGQNLNNFGSTTATQPSNLLFGKSTTATSQPPTASLFGNSGTAASQPRSTSLFGNNNTVTPVQSSLFGNGQLNQLTSTPPTKQYNFKDLPKSLTESSKTKKTTDVESLSRKSSLSNPSSSSTTSNPSRSYLFEKLSTRFSSLKTQANYNSEGLFSPKKDFIHTATVSEKNREQVAQVKQTPKLPFGTTNLADRPRNAPRGATTDFLKLKIDPSRSEARRLKIFGPDGGAQKVRILAIDNTPTDVADDDIQQQQDSQPFEKVLDPKLAERNSTDQLEDTSAPTEGTKTVKNSAQDDEYWCSPSVEELSEYSLRELSEISGFTVGRKGVGAISFNLPVDLTAFWSDIPGNLFNNIIKINKNKTVEVYPNDHVPLGTGLNVPATITLEKCFPVTKSGKHTHDSRTKDLELRLFVRKLKIMKDMEFVAYEPFSGAWTFKVKHFSIWGLINEDDEVVDVESELERLKKASTASDFRSSLSSAPKPFFNKESNKKIAKLDTKRSPAEDTFVLKKHKLDDSFDFDMPSLMPGSFITEEEHESLYQNNSLNDIGKEESATPSEPEGFSILNDDFPADLDPSNVSFISGDDDEPMDFDEDSGMLDEKQFEPFDVEQEDFDVLDVDPSFSVDSNWEQQLKLSARPDSVFADRSLKRTTLYEAPFSHPIPQEQLDKLIFGDISKVIKTHKKIKKELRLENYNFTHFTQNDRIIMKSSSASASHTKIVSLDKLFGMNDRHAFESVYDKHVADSKISHRANHFPRVAKNTGISFGFVLKSFNNEKNDNEKNVWKLASVLFDNITSDEELSKIDDIDLVNKVLATRRREGLINWVKDEIASEIEGKLEVTADIFEQMFLWLVLFDLPNAAALAIKTNNNHLAVLISLLGSNDEHVKQSASRQLEQWKREVVIQNIPSGIFKVYQLLKGDILSKNHHINFTAGLSWKAVFGLLLSYGDVNLPLSTIINDFIGESSAIIPSEDLKFVNLFKIYIHKYRDDFDIGTVLSAPFTNNKLDVRLNWYIYEILIRSTDYVNVSNSVELGNKLTILFAEQLEASALWEQAIFVLSHIQSDSVCELEITKIIYKNISKIVSDENTVNRLQSILKIPESLINEGNALYYRYLGDHWKEAESLLDAGNYDEAHKTIIERVAPSAVINNGPLLQKLEKFIKRFPRGHLINDWAIGLAIYNNYIKLVKADNISSLKYLVDNLPSLKRSNFKIVVASNIISKRVAESLLETSERTDGELRDLNISFESISKLPFGESEAQYFGRRLTVCYLKQK